jgi:hypothetical protein
MGNAGSREANYERLEKVIPSLRASALEIRYEIEDRRLTMYPK